MRHLSHLKLGFLVFILITLGSYGKSLIPSRFSSPVSPTLTANAINSFAQAPILLTVDPTPDGESILPLLGVNAGPLPPAVNPSGADVTEQYQAIGVTMVRTHGFLGLFDMSVIYPDQNADPLNPASYDFEASDRAFQAILSGGFEPYLRLGDSYYVEGLEERAPSNPDNWIQAAVEVVRRYRHMADEAGIPLGYVEIWNEPDNPHFWDSTPLAFFELFSRTAQALKEAFPDLKVGGPGMSPAGALAPQGQTYTQDFLAYLKEHNVPLDFFSRHIYSNNPEDYRQAARFYRQQLDAHGYGATESHINEWNVEKDFVPEAPTEVAALLSSFCKHRGQVFIFGVSLFPSRS